jgi:nucleoside-diphosphate-sugar epimerase
MESDFSGPVNIGSDELISINDLAKMVIKLSGKNLSLKNIPGPEGVRGRNSDNTLIQEKLNWRPSSRLSDGVAKTYQWISSLVEKKYGSRQ